MRFIGRKVARGRLRMHSVPEDVEFYVLTQNVSWKPRPNNDESSAWYSLPLILMVTMAICEHKKCLATW